MAKICREAEASIDYYSLFKVGGLGSKAGDRPGISTGWSHAPVEPAAVCVLRRQCELCLQHICFPASAPAFLQAIMKRTPLPMTPLESLASSAVRHMRMLVLAAGQALGCLLVAVGGGGAAVPSLGLKPQ